MQDAVLRIRAGVSYRLVGVVVHRRLGLDSGHYTCYIENRKQNQWFHIDDDKVITGVQRLCIIFLKYITL